MTSGSSTTNDQPPAERARDLIVTARDLLDCAIVLLDRAERLMGDAETDRPVAAESQGDVPLPPSYLPIGSVRRPLLARLHVSPEVTSIGCIDI
jgi:hypothetical protein